MAVEFPKGFLRAAMVAPFEQLTCGTGEGAGLDLPPSFNMIFGAGSGACGNLSLILGTIGSGTACLASRTALRKKTYSRLIRGAYPKDEEL